MAASPAAPSATQRLAAFAGAGVLRGLFATLRSRIEDRSGFLADPPPHPVIFAFWHNRILAITREFLKVYPSGRRGVLVLTSASRDGMWLAEFVRQFGMGSVRGSSSRRGAAAMRELLQQVAAGYDIAITPDGPRGPRYSLGPGMIYLAARAGIPILPLHARFSAAWTLRTWDGFQIPKPFSRIDCTMGPVIRVPLETDEASFEEVRRLVEHTLREGAA